MKQLLSSCPQKSACEGATGRGARDKARASPAFAGLGNGEGPCLQEGPGCALALEPSGSAGPWAGFPSDRAAGWPRTSGSSGSLPLSGLISH